MEESSLSDSVLNGIGAYFAAQDEGVIVNSFITVAEVIRADGTVSMIFVCPEAQPLFRNLGLLDYGREWTLDDVRSSFIAASMEDDGE
jgi:hypothetical protein